MSERAEVVKAAFLATAKELEANLDKSAARIRELEAQLAEANARLKYHDDNFTRLTDERAVAVKRAEQKETEVHYYAKRFVAAERRAESAEADNAKLRAALEMVEAYMASEDGPIYRLWENCDIGDYDDYQTEWEQTLFDVRDWKNGCVPTASLGGGTEWPEVVLYREILAALSPQPSAEAPPAVFPWESGDRMRAELERKK